MAKMIAVGDSIVNGKTKDVAGVPGQSWARWAADAAGFEFEQYARGGATSSEIVRDLLPNVTGRYEFGVFNMGTNDAIKKLDLTALRENATAAALKMTAHCERVFTLSVPYSPDADAIIREVAEQHEIVVIDGALTGPRFFQPDFIHPTAVGQLELGDRLADSTGTPRPSLTAPQRGQGRLGVRYWIRYAYRWLKFRAKEVLGR
ncbi:GDSL-type esterase/lipase family protein [Demequina sp. SO4-18]|uniref:GDSL-type esterase/lipase family protein n=1 Tax=Demequina sp. SO4-18 TaxID=3401026 RepID=UPI003B5A7258